jgi:hypothetical protein
MSSPRLELIHTKKESLAAFRVLQKALKAGAEVHERNLGYQGGAEDHAFWWHPECTPPFWAVVTDPEGGNRFWNAFGTRLQDSGSHSIIVEINPPKEGPNQRMAGAFVRDDAGHIYLAHSGKVGGGKEGIGMSAFLDFWRGADMVDIACPEERTRKMILVAALDSPRCLQQVAHFVHEVAQFKQGGPRTVHPTQEEHWFTPEFQGPRKGYQTAGVVEASCDHGVVVSALAKALEGQRGFRVGNDRHRDLYLVSPTGHVPILFEVKTDLSTTSLYTGLGQLMLHGAHAEEAPQRVLVVPGDPDATTKAALSRLGVSVLPYTWKGAQPEFLGLGGVLDPALKLRP